MASMANESKKKWVVLREWWSNIGGGFIKLEQSEWLDLDDNTLHATIQKYKGIQREKTRTIGGLCLAITLSFVESRIQGDVSPETMMAKIENSMSVMAARQALLFDRWNNTISGRKGLLIPCASSTLGLSSPGREDASFYIMANPGIYTYAVIDNLIHGEGHIMCFDTRDNKFIFLDTNSGMWSKENATATEICKFLVNYWESWGYKKIYHRGPRYLYRFL